MRLAAGSKVYKCGGWVDSRGWFRNLGGGRVDEKLAELFDLLRAAYLLLQQRQFRYIKVVLVQGRDLENLTLKLCGCFFIFPEFHVQSRKYHQIYDNHF